MAAELHQTHYENFPIASILLPRDLREPVAAIYAFARSADDFADEGDLPAAERLALLDEYGAELDAIEAGQSTTHPVFLRLRPAIAAHGLPLRLFRDLLDAFRQDVTKARYADFGELTDYCRRSADPVGRLLLHLFRAATPENLRASDRICSALQLINHWQDVAIDFRKPRLYLPQEDLARFGVTEDQIGAGIADDNWRTLMKFEVDRARAMMLEGAPLGRALPGRIGLEIRAIVASGLRILEKIEAAGYDVLNRRPVLGALDWPRILFRAMPP
ncbi:MAG: squalene synthase HpnC [Candidatus Nitricoxidivorans perseverans]|uniref:Squalene synthase HpnC n=1 Tax=Candidatus Nitricoxidivorans perseverans TaxID=2975601 RepID=A0AA49FLV4_9PROT|nr:MAG: squalene synthase HpnC [Candidatus Nitricoxidivorans perseverans]